MTFIIFFLHSLHNEQVLVLYSEKTNIQKMLLIQNTLKIFLS